MHDRKMDKKLPFQRQWLPLLFICLLMVDSAFSEDDDDADDAEIENEVYFTRTHNAAHLPKRKERSFVETGTNRKLTFSDVVKESGLKRKKRDTDPDVLVEACKHHNPQVKEPIKCYHCKSNTRKEREPVCDHKLWKYLNHSEKTRLRETCDLEAKFCAKIVQQKLGERITTRGCFTEQNITGHRKKSRSVSTKIGCIVSRRKGYRQTLCLCNNDFCNLASEKNASVFSLLFVCLLLVSTLR